MSKCTAPEISTFPELLRNLVDGRKVTLSAKAYGVGFEKGVHRIPGHFDDAKIPIETNSGRLAPCTTAEAAEKGGEQVMARCWLWYPGSCRVAPGPCSTPKGSCVSQYDDTESNQYPFPSIASQEIPLDIFLGWIYRAYADDSVSSSLRRL